MQMPKNLHKNQDILAKKTTHTNMTNDKIAQNNSAQNKRAQHRNESSAEKDQRHCQTNFILTSLQRLNLSSLSFTPSLGGPVGISR